MAEVGKIADAAVVGSALVDVIAENLDEHGNAKLGLVEKALEFVFELNLYRAQLMCNRPFSNALSWHNKGSTNVPVFNKPLPIFNAQLIGNLHSRGSARIWNRNNGINIKVRVFF